jgi:NitT/TauT family transport system permease protein
MASIMKNKLLNKTLTGLLIAAFWIGVWYLAALIINSVLLLPTPHETLSALFELVVTFDFYKVVLLTLLRVLLGLALGISSGVIMAILCHKFELLKKVLNPAISVIRATPVASFIVLLWVLLNGSALSVTVAFLMVMPIVWQNTLDGFSSIPKELIEVANIYELSLKRKFKVLILPVLSDYIFPAVITSVGLAWKSEIAAEIIAYTKDSIGMHINDAKAFMLTPTIFAWTSVIVVMSIALEIITRKLLRRVKK